MNMIYPFIFKKKNLKFLTMQNFKITDFVEIFHPSAPVHNDLYVHL